MSMAERDNFEAWSKANALKTCLQCSDGEGGRLYPYYGVAPHIHAGGDEIGIGSTQLMPRAMWPRHFEPDLDDPGCGTYTHCPYCKAPNSSHQLPTAGSKIL
jgi:hypothetical protein